MDRRPIRGAFHGCTSRSSAASKRSWKYRGNRRIPIPVIQLLYKLANGKLNRVLVKVDKKPIVYVGPTVEGPDAEYIKIVSGKVDVRKPSFV